MPHFPRKEIPTGFALREFPADTPGGAGTWQAYRVDNPARVSPLYTRRLKAVNWCWLQIGQEAAAR